MNNYYDFTAREKVIGWCQLIGISAFIIWVLYAMLLTAPAGMIVMGGLIWWGMFAFETAFNGGQTDIESLFGYVRDDFKNNYGSEAWQHRMKLSNGNEEWAEMYPGKIHCITTHVIIPLAPLIIWMV